MALKGMALLLLAVALVGCISEVYPTATSPGRSVAAATQEPEGVTVDEAVALICAPPAYAECAEDIAPLLEGLSPLETLPGRQIFGVCALQSGAGAVVSIHSEAEADAECDELGPSTVVRVVELP